jgi:type IV fimbrial biogenesis protein FimT
MKRREKGLTLIELMVTLAVAIVILAIGIPAFTSFSARDTSAATVNALVTALQQARAQALSEAHSTAVCATVNASTTDTCGTDQTWNMGWLVFVEPASPDGARGAGDEISRRFPAPRPEVTITAPAGISAVRFMPTGEAVTPVTIIIRTYKNVSHQVADCVRRTDVLVSAVGQIRSEVKATCT